MINLIHSLIYSLIADVHSFVKGKNWAFGFNAGGVTGEKAALTDPRRYLVTSNAL
jgi:hypothetical protein